MLYIDHIPLRNSLPSAEGFRVEAIVLPYSEQNLVGSPTLYWRTDGGWNPVQMNFNGNNNYYAYIPSQPEGTEISYYIHAEDYSGRSENHPFIGAQGAHTFLVQWPTIYVDINAPPGGDGSLEHPFQHIQDGVNAALPDYIVSVAPGTYVESVVINTPHISVIGMDKDTTIVNSDDPFDPAIKISFDAHDVTIRGFTLSNSDKGVEIWCNDNIISGNIIRDNQAGGIKIYPDHDGNIISDNLISSNGFGAWIGIWITAFCDSNTITNNTLDQNFLNIKISTGSTGNLVYHNNFFRSPTGSQLNAVDDGNGNFWDNGPLDGGNYWDDWSGNGVYVIPGDGNGVDNYPFAEPNGWN
jgi:parallel beta-helix repeat protein